MKTLAGEQMQRDMRWAIFLCAASGLSASAASAQDIQNFKPALGTTNYLTVDSALVAPHWVFQPSVFLNYGKNPLVVRDVGTGKVRQEIISGLTTVDLQVAFGLYDRLELGLNAPLIVTSGQGVREIDEDGFGLGDIRFLPKVRLLGAADTTGIGLAVALPVSLPTASAKKGMGAGALSVGPKIIADVRLSQVLRVSLNGGYEFRTSNEDVGSTSVTSMTGVVQTTGVEVGSEFTYGAALGIKPGNDELELLAEVFGAAPAEDVEGGEEAKPLEAELGARWYSPWGVVLTGGGGFGIETSLGTPDYRIFFGAGWAVGDDAGDPDGDGLLGSADGCPAVAEDRDGFEDEDGCPEADDDRDGVVDAADRCPTVAETVNGFEDEDGCPDQGDSDGDGFKDDADQCPKEAEDKDGFEDENGCPEPDNDTDTILDAADLCPLNAEDLDSFDDQDGCPEFDNDKDGVLDADDKCPLEPEVVNGIDDQDGCPDKGVSSVRITSERIEILQKVFFDNDKDSIKPVSFNLLGQVSAALKAHPEMAKVRVEGHTDRWGDPARNLDLSKRRAAAVVRYLVEVGGLSPSRLESGGYGYTRPLDPRLNFKADDKNRRVEFVVVGGTTPTAPAGTTPTPEGVPPEATPPAAVAPPAP